MGTGVGPRIGTGVGQGTGVEVEVGSGAWGNVELALELGTKVGAAIVVAVGVAPTHRVFFFPTILGIMGSHHRAANNSSMSVFFILEATVSFFVHA